MPGRGGSGAGIVFLIDQQTRSETPMPHTLHIAILGHSGAGKSTLARWLARRLGNDGDPLPHLDLDTIAWLPGQIAVARPADEAAALVRAWCAAHPRGILEGCYGSLVRVAISAGAHLIWLDPDLEQCLAHCRARPFEPHKYPTAEDQHALLPMLLDWVQSYPTREGELGRADHQRCFDECERPKIRLREVVALDGGTHMLEQWLAGQ